AKRKAFALLIESLLALRRENKEVLWSSMVKDTIKRKKPSFNETYHGYRTFSDLLEDAQREGLLELETDKRSRTYVVTRFGSEIQRDRNGAGTPAGPAPAPRPPGPPARQKRPPSPSPSRPPSPAGHAPPGRAARPPRTPRPRPRPPAAGPPAVRRAAPRSRSG